MSALACVKCGRPFLPREMYAPIREARGFGSTVVAGRHIGPCPVRRPFREARIAAGIFPPKRDPFYG